MKSAPIHFGSIAYILDDYLAKNTFSSIFFLVDENTHVHCLPILLADLDNISAYEILEIDAGEENKNIDTVTNLWLALSELGADRHSLVINVGGGVLTDMGGFMASTFKRGIKFINIPTTLLSMVDASAGGKNGIDLEGMKNMVGTFNQPEMVLIDPKFLLTLEQRQVKSGLAEMLKHGLIKNRDHWDNLVQLPSHDAKSLAPFIMDSIHLKENVVESDPYEKGERKILNFGHTIGHAIESESLETDFPLLHGEAIVIGMIIETFLSYDQELISKIDLEEVCESFSSMYALNTIDMKIFPNLMEWMKHDKKNQNNSINFSLINKIGNCRYDVVCTEDEIRQAFEKYNKWIA
ncbi:3-dehydroquinate synthase [Empedobacter brevis]|uniref:3-dehydroquinate synthase n=1 Tax=Empedobacter brevis NBRC 14943 = ATCC 43319 TaxID=1218108 RepID=A0A511NGI8_9FLAO|nr:3-dehydroquinate synthase [Empedobacter brevis]GEM51912.1 3-dehydroquinate synthase [Empedobacter brevis NBRC 14943 = ATCC 43319]